MQDTAARLARYWWLALVFVGGLSVILFSQLKFDTGESVAATVVSTGVVEGVTGKEVYLVVETDDGVSAKVDGNRNVAVDDRVMLNVYDRILFRDIYSLK